MAIRVLIADDHPIVRSGVSGELARHADIEVIGEATNGDEAAQQTETLQPEVLVLDIQMPGLKATEVIRRVRALSRPVRVLILTAHGDIDNVRNMLGAGAMGYILKDEAPEVIADAVRAVAEGKAWFSGEVAQGLAQAAMVESQLPPVPDLTKREIEILNLVAKGFSNKQIAEELHVSERTIRFHMENILTKLNADNRVEAVTIAIKRTWVAL
jgi:DNA-binding NarL/FixJ family response regulator